MCDELLFSNELTGANKIESLFQVAGDVGKAVGSLVNIMTDDEDSADDDRKPSPRKL